MAVNIRTSSGTSIMLPDDMVDQLRASLQGQLLSAGAPGYDEARTIWNAMIDRHPALIARCASTDDVTHAVRFARENTLLLSVRGGGHNIAGNAVCEDGLMLDLTPMKTIAVDRASRTARVAPGVTLGELDRATQEHGLAVPLGINSTTGVAGLTLGGGFGWLSRSRGLSIDNLRSVEVVNAAGERLQANERDHSDLFWGIRGGGGNFGVVTSFEFGLHEVGPQVLAGLIVHPLAAAKDVLRFYRDFLPGTPEELVCWFVLRKAPPLPFLSSEWHGREILALAVCYCGDIADGERIAKPLRSFGHPLADIIAPMPYTAWQTILDPLLTPGARNYWKSHDFLSLSDGLIDVLTDFAARIPDPQTEIAFVQLGGAVSRIPPTATAYTHRDAQFVINVHGRWQDPSKDEACIGWARQLYQASSPFATGGVYVNFLTQDEESRVGAAYGSNYERLVALKNRYDPTNLFRVNQNIRPTAYAIPGPGASETQVRF